MGRMNGLNNQISGLESRISSIDGSVSSQINAISQNVQEQLGEQVRIVADYTYEIKLTVGFTSAGVTENQVLETLYDLKADSQMRINANFQPNAKQSGEKLSVGGAVEIEVSPSYKDSGNYGDEYTYHFGEIDRTVQNWPVNMVMKVFADDKVVKKYPVDLSWMFDKNGIVQLDASVDTASFPIDVHNEFSLKGVEYLKFVLFTTDNLGIVREIEVWGWSNDAAMQEAPTST